MNELKKLFVPSPTIGAIKEKLDHLSAGIDEFMKKHHVNAEMTLDDLVSGSGGGTGTSIPMDTVAVVAGVGESKGAGKGEGEVDAGLEQEGQRAHDVEEITQGLKGAENIKTVPDVGGVSGDEVKDAGAKEI
jgi:hypothetical protein